MLSSLRRQQSDLRHTLKDAEAVLIKPGDLQLIGKGEIRDRLAAQLKTYTQFKHEVVFPALLVSPDPIIAQLATQMRCRCEAVANFYRSYLTEWPPARIIEQPALFRGVALDVIGRLRQHLVREEADAVRLTARAAPVARRAVDRPQRSGF